MTNKDITWRNGAGELDMTSVKLSEDPTKIKLNRAGGDPKKIVNQSIRVPLQTNVKQDRDPTILHMSGVAYHGNTPFNVPYMSHIEGNLYQGGIDQTLGLQLPHYIKHLVSLYPWESYQIKHDLDSVVIVKMFDSLDQSLEQVDAIAAMINIAKKSGPVLVHCQAGLNRSSLVLARALMLDGKTADEAINLIRSHRSEACLCNSAFEQHLRSLD